MNSDQHSQKLSAACRDIDAAQPDQGVLSDVQNKIAGALDLLENISKEDEIQMQINLRDEELKRAIEAEQKASRAKSDFIFRMSHEIRTPLNAIIGMTRIAKDTKEIQKIDYCLQKIGVASATLLSNINNVLDMSKIETGKLELDHVKFSLEAVIKDVYSVVSVRADEKKQILRVNVAPDIPKQFVGDAVRLGQVFMNLLFNAVKFTPNEGKIVLSITSLESDENISTIQISVKDTGIGMTQDVISRIFEPYEQASADGLWRGEGTGLGLPISKNIIELMRGTVSVTSIPGKGSEFIFTVMLENVAEEKTEPEILTGRMLRILVVDPYMEDESEYYNLLNGKSAEIIFATNQSDLFNMVENNVFAHHPFDVIFLDCDIMSADGIHIIQDIQKRFGKQNIVLLVAETQFGELERIVKPSEVLKMLPRPLLASSAIQAIDELIGHGSTPDVPIQENFAGKKVLLAEDVADNAEILRTYLEDRDIQVDWACDGKMATEMYEHAQGSYDLVLLDIQMPIMNGYQTSRRIRQFETSLEKHVPIIGITANVFRDDLNRCMAAGMDDYVTKPLDKDRALARIFSYFIKDGTMAELPTSYETGADVYFNDKENTDMMSLPLVNFSDGLERIEGNAVLYLKLLTGFSEGNRKRELIEAWESGDQEQLGATIHLIKGLAGNLAFTRLHSLLVTFEQEVGAGIRSPYSFNQVCRCFADTIAHITNNSLYLKKASKTVQNTAPNSNEGKPLSYRMPYDVRGNTDGP